MATAANERRRRTPASAKGAVMGPLSTETLPVRGRSDETLETRYRVVSHTLLALRSCP